jgi:hypothetical protein
MPSRVAQYFDEENELQRNAGYSEISVFVKRERFMIPFK